MGTETNNHTGTREMRRQRGGQFGHDDDGGAGHVVVFVADPSTRQVRFIDAKGDSAGLQNWLGGGVIQSINRQAGWRSPTAFQVSRGCKTLSCRKWTALSPPGIEIS